MAPVATTFFFYFLSALTVLSGVLVMDLLRAHPFIVMNGVLHENSFYTSVEEMLCELEQRCTMS